MHSETRRQNGRPVSTGREKRRLPKPPVRGEAPRRNGFSLVLTFCIVAFFWLLFSGRFDGFHIAMGIVSSAIVAASSHRLFFPRGVDRSLPGIWIRFIAYFPWLFRQIFLANLRLMYLVFHPRMKDLIEPNIVEFGSRLNSDVARTTFANSITLTPGTITVNVSIMGRFAVHCIDRVSGETLPGEMERKISRIFGE